mmetsp:Transcript_16876/g.23883  ORF Transcript_16876/g.23883 Transcript_16876/m.23883 type:complete len:451 (+) Transcript_16876:195-1547(+)
MPPQHQENGLNWSFSGLDSRLVKELADHNSFFDDLVDMIPAKLYIAGNTGDDMYNPKYGKGQSKESKEARRARNKLLKVSQFNPSTSETTLQAKKRIEQENVAMDEDSDNDENLPPDNHEEEDEEVNENASVQNPGNNDIITKLGQSRIEALREKLRAKLEEKRLQRPGGADGIDPNSSGMISKRAARRAEKQRRIELAKRKAGKSGSTQVKGNVKGIVPTIKIKKDMGGTRFNDINASSSSPSSNPMDDLTGIDFGGIAGLNPISSHKDNKSLGNIGKKKSLERLLAEAEAKKERLKQLKASDEAEDKAKAKNMEWGDTLKAATGEKNKNTDTSQLKKQIKRKVKKKAKSQEAWKSRMENVKEKMDERQKIRNHNIDKRKLGGAAGANLSKKRINEDEKEKDAATGGKKRPRLGPHSGKGRAGFEGKKQDFINKEKSIGSKNNKKVANQ